jgi:hypothetical protein
MKKQLIINNPGKRSYRTLLLIAFCAILAFSCKSGDNRLIPEKDLVSVLTEIYVADGVLALPGIHPRFADKDSTGNYIDILERHNLTKKRIDNTLSFYFTRDPKKLQNIYDQVLTWLNERQTLLEKATPPVHQPPYNFWPRKESINVPESGVKDPVWFSVQIKDTGNFMLAFTGTLFPDDQSINPRTTVFFWHTDSSKAENRVYWPEVSLVKDALAHEYSLSKRNSDFSFNHIGGWILNSDPREGRWEKHAIIQYIRIHKLPIQ